MAPVRSTSAGAAIEQAMIASQRAQLVQLARRDFATFAEYVLEDEGGGGVQLAPMHHEWCDLLDRHQRLVLFSFLESGKSSLITVARVLWTLGHDPSARICIVSNTATLAEKPLALIARYIQHSERLRAVFPNLLPDTGAKWRNNAITVKRKTFSRDPSVQAVGIGGSILGARLSMVLLDDVETWLSTRTPQLRATTAGWVRSMVLGRLVEGGRVVALGPTWHEDALLERLEQDGWPTYRFAITDEDGQSRWPERWSPERIAEKRVELGRRGAANQLDLVPMQEGGLIDPRWVDAAVARGMRLPLPQFLLHVPEGDHVVCGVDLAVGQSEQHDRTAIVTVISHPGGRREVLAVDSGRWTAPDIIKRIISVHMRYRPTEIRVESTGQQGHLIQMTKALGDVPVRPHHTGRGKHSLQFGVDALAVELERNAWVIRGGDTPEVQALCREITYYDPKAHVGDRLAALVLARHAAEERSNRVERLMLDFSRR